MSGHIRNDNIRNGYIRDKVRVAPIEKKMIETRLRWFGYVQRRLLEALIRKVDQMIFSSIRKGRERPKRTLGEIIKRDL